MNKTLGIGIILCGLLLTASTVKADGYFFEPAQQNNGYTYVETPTPSIAAASTTATTPATAANTKLTNQALDVTGKESGNYQNALLELDNAQVEVRTRLLDYKQQYSDIDQKYVLIKEQRSASKKLVKQTEKKINSIEKAKSKIRKEML